MESYQALLARAHEKLPPVRTGGERFQVPDPDVMTDGKNTVIRNLQEITGVLRREPAHVIGFLAKEFAARPDRGRSLAVQRGEPERRPERDLAPRMPAMRTS